MLPNVPKNLPSVGALNVPVRRRPTPAQVTARATNWLYACIAGAVGSLSCNRVLAQLPEEDAADLDLALRALWRIDQRRIARKSEKKAPHPLSGVPE